MGRLVLRRILGVACMFIGIAGLFLPLTPGVLFIILGMELAGLGFLFPPRHRERVRGWMDRLRETLGFRKR